MVLLTRPAAQSDRFAQQLAARFGGVRVVISPLMAPAFLEAALPPGPFAALILTSETGAEALRRIAPHCPDLPRAAFCIGTRAAAVAGVQPLATAPDAEALFTAICGFGPIGPILHLRGREARGDLAARLTAAGLSTAEAVVYAQEVQPLTAEARALLAQAAPLIVPLFSPRSAAVLAEAVAEVPSVAPLWVAALSPAVAGALTGLHPARLEIAQQPHADAMLAAIARLALHSPAA